MDHFGLTWERGRPWARNLEKTMSSNTGYSTPERKLFIRLQQLSFILPRKRELPRNAFSGFTLIGVERKFASMAGLRARCFISASPVTCFACSSNGAETGYSPWEPKSAFITKRKYIRW